MRSALTTLLSNDVALAAILTGGIHACGEINRQLAPGAFNEVGEIQPCALVSVATAAPNVSGIDKAVDQFIYVYFYDAGNYLNIDAAIKRVYALLHRQRITLSGAYCYEIIWADDLQDSEDPALRCLMRYSRFKATILRS